MDISGPRPGRSKKALRKEMAAIQPIRFLDCKSTSVHPMGRLLAAVIPVSPKTKTQTYNARHTPHRHTPKSEVKF